MSVSSAAYAFVANATAAATSERRGRIERLESGMAGLSVAALRGARTAKLDRAFSLAPLDLGPRRGAVGRLPKRGAAQVSVVRRRVSACQRAGSVTMGALCVVPVSVSENRSIRKLNAALER